MSYRCQTQARPAPVNTTRHQRATRYYAEVHGHFFVAATVQEVFDKIDDYEIEGDLIAASYIVNDSLEGLLDDA